MNAAVREHGLTYSIFANALVKKSNIELDRKVLSNIAVNEPKSFKSVIDEVRMQAGLSEVMRRKPMVNKVTAVSLPEAFARGLVVERKRPKEIDAILNEDAVKTKTP